MKHFCSAAKKFLSHFFHKKWDYCYRMNNYHDVANQRKSGASVNIAPTTPPCNLIQGQDTVTGAVGENIHDAVYCSCVSWSSCNKSTRYHLQALLGREARREAYLQRFVSRVGMYSASSDCRH
jgi:hypothetical protein